MNSAQTERSEEEMFCACDANGREKGTRRGVIELSAVQAEPAGKIVEFNSKFLLSLVQLEES
jgi:hypothetical protein